MKMIRFKEDITDQDEVIWQKGNIYRIINEEDDQITLESDSIKNEIYSIQKSDLNSYCFAYICNGIININCYYCKYMCENEKEKFCEILKRSKSNG